MTFWNRPCISRGNGGLGGGEGGGEGEGKGGVAKWMGDEGLGG